MCLVLSAHLIGQRDFGSPMGFVFCFAPPFFNECTGTFYLILDELNFIPDIQLLNSSFLRDCFSEAAVGGK